MPANDNPIQLRDKVFEPFPLGQIRPEGWLLNQLRIQADGLTGHLDEFWPDVGQSGWIGGAAEGWERGPYWLDGVVPLAFLLDDPDLKAKTRHWVDYILTHQHADGWLGPVLDARYGYEYDPWPVYVTLKALSQYHDATGDGRVVDVMERFFRRLDTLLDEQPLKSWGHMRWADLVLSIHWLHERTGAPWLLALAAKARDQGFDWRAHFENFPYTGKTPREECNLLSHVVNNAMGIKQPGVWFRQGGDTGDRDAGAAIMGQLDRYHGQATGVFTGDEHLAGASPSQGTELCAVVEYMYSLEVLAAVLGLPQLGDRLERITFNALPATFKPDMWAHQYDQQVNQVQCRVAEDRVWTSNGPDANIYGLAPHFGCCTANMHQGWPKFAAHLWMRAGERGLAAIAYAPSTVSTRIADTDIHVTLATDYPFGELLQFTVRVDEPVRFDLLLRIPEWAGGATVQVGAEPPMPVAQGTFQAVEREWQGETAVTLRLPMRPAIDRGYAGSATISRGPLVFALPIGEEWKLIGGEPPHGDWEVYPTTPWNYALELDPRDPAASLQFEAQPVGDAPFSPEGAPIRATVRGRRLPGWGLEHNAASPPPQSPVRSDEPSERLTLIPYGSTNLRIGEFPVLADE